MKSIADRLLYYISVRRQVPMPLFRRAAAYFLTREGLEGDAVNAWRFADAFSRIGFCEITSDGKRHLISATQPTLARLPVNDHCCGFVTGARLPSLHIDIEKWVKRNHSDMDVDLREADALMQPTKILLHAKSSECLSEAAKAFGLTYDPIPSAWQILHFVNPLQNLSALLPRRTGDPMLNWKSREYSVRSLVFQPGLGKEVNTRLIEFAEPNSNRRRYRFISDDHWCEVERSEGVRLILASSGVAALRYDRDTETLSVASHVLPRWYERALTLCSGNLPHRKKLGAQIYWEYSAVPKTIAELVYNKAGMIVSLRESHP